MASVDTGPASSFNFPPNLQIKPSTLPALSLIPSQIANDEEKWIADYGIAGRIWEASYALSIYLRPPESFRWTFSPECPLRADSEMNDSTVLELGAGTGFLGLQIASLLPSSALVFLTDLSEVCPLLEQNAAHARSRGPSADVIVRPLAWGSSADAKQLAESIARVPVQFGSGGGLGRRQLTHIVCSDLVYWPRLLAPLLKTLLILTSPNLLRHQSEPAQVIIAYTMRNLELEAPFWSAFGYWFNFTPVLLSAKPPATSSFTDALNALADAPRSLGDQFASVPFTNGSLYGTYIFLANRKSETRYESLPPDEELLDYGRDSFFETMLLMNTSSTLFT